jgi:hypothetical protein
MNNLFSQQQDGYQSPNERVARALEGIWKELAAMNKRGRWSIDDLIARDIAADMNAEIDKQVSEQPKSVSELPVDEWSDEQKKQAKEALLNRLRGFNACENPQLRKWLVWSWNRFCDDVIAWGEGRLRYKPKYQDWAKEIGLVQPDHNGGAGVQRVLCHNWGFLTKEQYKQ